MMVAGAFAFYFSYRNTCDRLDQQAQITLSSSVRQMDNMIEQVHMTSLRLTSSTLFKALSDLDGQDMGEFSYTGYGTQNDLRMIFPQEQLMFDGTLFIYMENSNYVISTNSFSSYDTTLRFHPEYAMALESSSGSLMDPGLWRRLLPLRPSPQAAPDGYLYIIPISSSLLAINSDTSNVLCLEVNRDTLESYFADVLTDEDFFVYAVNLEGETVFSLGNESAAQGTDLTALSYDENGTAFFSSDQGTMRSVCVSSDYNAWRYYFVQPSSSAYYSANRYQTAAIAAAALTVVLEIAFIFFFTRVNSRPVAQLSHQLASQESLTSSLTNIVEKNRPLVAESYTRRLMEGSITTNEQMAHIIEEMGLNRPEMQYQVLYVEVSSADSFQPNITDLKLCIQNYDILVKEALNRYFPNTGYIYKPRDQIFACLLAAPSSLSDEESRQKNLELFTQFHQELLTKYSIWSCGGFGERNEIVSYIWKSYQQARNARSIATKERFVLSYSDFVASADVYYFPESLAVQLSGFISTGSKPQVEACFRQLKEENLERRSLSYTQLRWLISDVRTTVFRKRQSLDSGAVNTQEKTDLLDLIDRQFDGDMDLNTLETISLELCQLYGSGSESNELIAKIQEYINANYADSTLSLTRISEEFHISENYFSYLFKKEVSENFSTYLEKLRMAKAKELVTETATSISELYQYVGYNNAASFRRVFKKNFGVSPKEMRDKMNNA